MLWLSTTTWRPNLPHKRLTPHYFATCALVAAGSPPFQTCKCGDDLAPASKKIHVVYPQVEPQKNPPLQLLMYFNHSNTILPQPFHVTPR